MSSIKQRAVKCIFWSAIENFSVQGVRFIIGLILVRLLIPADYGLIGMLAIFIAIAQSFINSGFTSALIIKTKNPTQAVFSIKREVE